MSERSDERPDQEDLRLRVLGLGDQSLRKSHYAELRRRMRDLERFRALLDASTDGILMVDLQSRQCVDLNRAAKAMLEQIGESPEAFSVEEILSTERAWLDEPGGQASTRRVRVDLKGKTGTLPVELTADRRRFEERDYAVFVLRDLRERLRLERRAETAQKLASMGKLAGMVAHDFNNVLGGIRGLCELALLELPADSSTRGDVEDIRKAASRAADLSRQLLLFSRQQPSEAGPANLNRAIREVDRILSGALGVDIRCDFELEDGLWNVAADPTQLGQVVMNLVINARDAMPQGGSLRVTTANVTLDTPEAATYLNDTPPGQYVHLRVSDTGRGIAPEARDRLFEPFFTTKPAGKGTGLGLATVYGVVTRYRGGIRVDSTLGQGTTFDVVLPRVEEEAPSTVEGMDRESSPGAGTVLVAEDDETIRKVVTRALTKYGYRVLIASGPAEVLEVARAQGPIHLLLTDIIMPTMSGFELAEKFRACHPHAAVLYMSGFSEEGHADHAAELDPENFLQKPFSVQELVERIASLLEQRP